MGLNGSGKNGGASLTEQASQQELILEKIKLLLKDTDPDRWKKGGEKLRAEDRFEKPRNTWEMLYTLEIKNGVLAVRCSSPVKSDFQGQGFQLVPIGPALHTVEVRAKGWHHSELTDPYKRSQISDRRCDVLAEGETAKKLYEFVEHAYANYHNSQQQNFDKEAYDFVCSLPSKLKEETVNRWERSEDTPGDVHYIAYYDLIKVDASRNFKEQREQYELAVSKGKVVSQISDRGLCKEIFHCVEELGQTSRLLTLSKALEF